MKSKRKKVANSQMNGVRSGPNPVLTDRKSKLRRRLGDEKQRFDDFLNKMYTQTIQVFPKKREKNIKKVELTLRPYKPSPSS